MLAFTAIALIDYGPEHADLADRIAVYQTEKCPNPMPPGKPKQARPIGAGFASPLPQYGPPAPRLGHWYRGSDYDRRICTGCGTTEPTIAQEAP